MVFLFYHGASERRRRLENKSRIEKDKSELLCACLSVSSIFHELCSCSLSLHSFVIPPSLSSIKLQVFFSGRRSRSRITTFWMSNLQLNSIFNKSLISESLWKFLKVSESLWNSLKFSEIILKVSVSLWKFLKVFESLWKSLKVTECHWKSQKVSWKSLKVF